MPVLQPTSPDEPRRPDAQKTVERRAARFAESPELMSAFVAATKSQRSWERAAADPAAYLARRDIAVPRGLEVRFTAPTRVPSPGWSTTQFTVTRCQIQWVLDSASRTLKKEQVCYTCVIQPIKPRLVG